MLPLILGLPFAALGLATPASSINDAADGLLDEEARMLERRLPTDLSNGVVGAVKALESLPSGIMSEANALAVVLEPGPPRTQVSPDVYDKLSYYAQFPGSVSGCLNKAPDGIVEQLYMNETETDTQAMIYRLDARRELILAIPGTQGDRDWATNFNLPLMDYSPAGSCQSCKVHRGFSIAWNSILNETTRGLESALETHPGYSVTIVGHSLGGALAELAFGSLKPGPWNVTQVITYGAPRVGNRGFAEYLDTLAGASTSNPGISYRVTHYDDIVPHVPPFFLGFSHPRTEYWQSADEAEEATTYRCYSSESLDCILGRVPSLKSDAHGTYAGMKNFC